MVKLKHQSASQNVKVQAEVSKHKLECQSAKVQIEIHSPSTFQVQWSQRELIGQNMSWSPLTLLFPSHPLPRSMIFITAIQKPDLDILFPILRFEGINFKTK